MVTRRNDEGPWEAAATEALVDALLESAGASTSPMADELRSGRWATALMRHAWPGNVRELRNTVERVVALRDLPDLEALLAQNGNNVSAAARAAGVDRIHLHRLLARVGLR